MINESQPSSHEQNQAWQAEPEKIQTESEQKNWIQKIIEFQRTKKGKAIQWLTVLSGITSGSFLYGRLSDRQSRDEAWKEFQAGHQNIEQLCYTNLDAVPNNAEAEVFRQRDLQYEFRLQGAYNQFLKETSDTTRANEILKGLAEFHPSQYDAELKKQGLGSMIDLRYPLPAIKFGAPKAQKEGGEYVFTPEASVADTIFISDESLARIQHEYLHGLGVKYGGGIERRRDHHQNTELNEGVTELIRLKIDKALGEHHELPAHLYEGERFTAYLIQELMGENEFWAAIKNGDSEQIRHVIENKFGKGAFDILLNKQYGLVGLINPHILDGSQAEVFDATSRAGILDQKYFDSFKDRYGIAQENPGQYVVYDSHEQPFGVIKPFQGKIGGSFINQGELVNFADTSGATPFSQLENGSALVEQYLKAKSPQERIPVQYKIARAVEKSLSMPEPQK